MMLGHSRGCLVAAWYGTGSSQHPAWRMCCNRLQAGWLGMGQVTPRAQSTDVLDTAALRMHACCAAGLRMVAWIECVLGGFNDLQ